MAAFGTGPPNLTSLHHVQVPPVGLFDGMPLFLLLLFSVPLRCQVFLASYPVCLDLVVVFIGEAVDRHCGLWVDLKW